MKAAEKEKEKAEKAKTKAAWDAGDALFQLANQALSSSSDLDSLMQNLISGLSSFVNTAAQQMMPGPGGLLFGGLLSFAINAMSASEQALPIEDDAVRMILVNARDVAIEMAAVRDSREIGFNADWQSSFARAAAS